MLEIMKRYNSTTNIYLRPLIRWHGGKVKKSRRLIEMIPSHRRFLDVSVGGGSLAFNKDKSKIEIFSDINPNVINLYTVVRDNAEELISLVEMTETSRATFDYAINNEFVDPTHRALAFLIRNRMSYRALGRNYESNSHWHDMPKRIRRIAERLRRVEIKCADLFEQIKYARSSTFIFIDPPYLNSHYTMHGQYDWTLSQHLHLLDIVTRSKAKILLTASDTTVYSDKLKGWSSTHWSMPVMGIGRSIIEVAWKNYA